MPHHQPIKKVHKSCNPHPKCCLLFPGTRDDHPVRPPVLALVHFISERGQQFQTKLLLLQGWKLVSDVKHPNLDQVDRETSALLGRPMPMHGRKKLQKKETSAPIPKKYIEYEVSRGELLGEAHRLRPPTLARHYSNYLHELLYDRRS